MIPIMDDPLGAYWRQPADIREAPMDDVTVLLTPAQFAELHSYDTSMPTGVYPGKCWKRAELDKPWFQGGKKTGVYYLVWYGLVEGRPDLCSNNMRRIEVVS